MPLFKCTKCHHEWEYYDKKSTCDWCGAKGEILEKETSFEGFCKMMEIHYKLNKIGKLLFTPKKERE